MKALRNIKPNFTSEYIEEAIASGRGMRDLISEFRTTETAIWHRIKELFGDDSREIRESLHKNDVMNSSNGSDPLNSSNIPSHIFDEIDDSDQDYLSFGRSSGSLFSSCKIVIGTSAEDIDKKLKKKVSGALNDSLDKTVERMLREDNSEEDSVVTDTSVTRAEIKRLEKELSDADKILSDSRSKLKDAEKAKTDADDKAKRAEEKLLRAKRDVNLAWSNLDIAKSSVESAESRCSELKLMLEAMKRELEDTTLPIFKIVSVGEGKVSLKAVNYDLEKNHDSKASVEWAHRIGENYEGLKSSEFSALARLFSAIAKLKGKYKVEIDPGLTRVTEVFDMFNKGKLTL